MKKIMMSGLAYAVSMLISASAVAYWLDSWMGLDNRSVSMAIYGNLSDRNSKISLVCDKTDMTSAVQIKTPPSVEYRSHSYPRIEVRLPISQMWFPKDSWRYTNGGSDIRIDVQSVQIIVDQLVRLIEIRGQVDFVVLYHSYANDETISQTVRIGNEDIQKYADRWLNDCEG